MFRGGRRWLILQAVPFDGGCAGARIARAALEYVTEYANRREAFGGRNIDNQGGPSRPSVAGGYITDHPVEKWYRDAKLYTIFEGTSEIQRMVTSTALGTADGAPPLHVDLDPSGGPTEPVIRPRRGAAWPGIGGRAVGAGPHPRTGHADRNESAAAPA